MIEITEYPVADLEVQTQGAGVPPMRRTGVGSGFSGNGGDMSVFEAAFSGEGDWQPQMTDQEEDSALFWGLHNELEREWNDPTAEPILIREFERDIVEFGLMDPILPATKEEAREVERKTKRFVERCRKAGLIKKPRRLTIREYIGALLW